MAQRFNREDREAVLHLVTLNIREKKRPFVHDSYARKAVELLRKQCDDYPAKLIAYVAMPDHMHFIINPRDGLCTRFLKNFKPACAVQIAEISARDGKVAVLKWIHTPNGISLWQEGKHSFHLWGQRLIWQKIDYIHNNPVKAGLVKTADQYPYSSFCAIYPGYGEPIVPVDKNFWWDEEDELG